MKEGRKRRDERNRKLGKMADLNPIKPINVSDVNNPGKEQRRSNGIKTAVSKHLLPSLVYPACTRASDRRDLPPFIKISSVHLLT